MDVDSHSRGRPHRVPSLRPAHRSHPGFRCPTARGSPRASGCRRTPRPTPYPRSSSTSPTGRATPSPGAIRHHPYFAGHGYAGVRVDLRGSGDSDGILLDEYLTAGAGRRARGDRLARRAALVQRHRGMIGISWGGFNGCRWRRAGRGLKAVISMCASDDRYSDDVHYVGGCVLAVDMLQWAATMLTLRAAAGSRGGGRRLAGDLARTHGADAALRRGLARPPAPDDYWRQIGVRGLRQIERPSTRSEAGRTATRTRCPASWRVCRARARASSGPGRTPSHQDGEPGPPLASSRSACAGGTTGSRASTPASWTSPRCAPGSRTWCPRPITTESGRVAGSPRTVALAVDRGA